MTDPSTTPGTFRRAAFLTKEVADASCRSNAGWLFPCAPEAVAHAARFYAAAEGLPFGSLRRRRAGHRQLGELLGCPPREDVRHRAGRRAAPTSVRHALPKRQVLAPASFFGCRASLELASRSSGSIRRLTTATAATASKISSCRRPPTGSCRAASWPWSVPEDVADEYPDVRRHFAGYYENCTIVPFPGRTGPSTK